MCNVYVLFFYYRFCKISCIRIYVMHARDLYRE